MHVQELLYSCPATVPEAVALLAGGEARALAGGTDLIAQLREGRREAKAIVDLKRIAELTALERTPGGGWRIGAAVSVGNLGRDTQFAAEYGGLLESARLIGSLQIQNRASLGGNLCNAAPSADAVPLLISHEATVEIAGPGGRRTVPVAALATGPGRSSLLPGELLVAIVLPAVKPRTAAKYLRFTPRREMDIAVAGAGTVLHLDSNGRIAGARITLASVAPVPLVAEHAQTHLAGKPPSAALFVEAGAMAASEARPISDTRGSAEYRRELVAILTCRTLEACALELGVVQQ
jgi:aerobic carbon-monoxide dehydrogenase medium subunit